MSNFWARFEEVDGNIYRWDTRIYIKPVNDIKVNDICLGAVVGKNPGSARGELSIDLKEINLDGDKLLPTVRNIFIKSYDLINMLLPNRAYIQVLNLFYLCEANLNLAINEAKRKAIKGICQAEKKSFPFVWFAWGGDDKFLNIYKNRFSSIKANQFFYYDNQKRIITQELPAGKSPAKHTQGLTHSFVMPHISNILKEIQT